MAQVGIPTGLVIKKCNITKCNITSNEEPTTN
jgi:hypothetical protein